MAQRNIINLNSIYNSLMSFLNEEMSNTDASMLNNKNLETLNGSYVVGFAARITIPTPSNRTLLSCGKVLNIYR